MNRSVLFYPIDVSKCTDEISKACLECVISKATEIACKDTINVAFRKPVGDEFVDNDEYVLGVLISVLYRLERRGL